VQRERREGRPGAIRDTGGEVLGQHDGISGFTVGQRRGLGLGGGPPRYVLRIVPDTAEVVVGDAEELASTALRAVDARWPAGRPDGSFDAEVRIRYRHRPAAARVTPTTGGFEVEFHEPQRAITPGQASVVYRGDEVIGGGFIA